MLDYLKESFITEYFRYKIILGDFIENSREIFTKLSKPFLIPKESIEDLYELVEKERIADIKTESDFNQFQRELQYFSLSGIKTVVSKEEQDIISLKGNAIVQAREINCVFDVQQTKMIVEKNLISEANNGNILAMRMVAFLMIENVFLSENFDQGIKYLKKSCLWNDVNSLFYKLYYTQDDKDDILSKLEYLLEKNSQESVYHYVEKRYGKNEKYHDKEVDLLENLFKLGMVKREVYSGSYARALYSEILDYKNKEKLFFSTAKDFATLVGDLPLKLTYNKNIIYEFSAFSNIPLKREAEIYKIKRFLMNSDLRQQTIYKPLCLVSNSSYIRSIYMDVIKKMAKMSNVELISAAELDNHDFEQTKNNIFVRSCDEDKDNIYFIDLQGDINEYVTREIRFFLSTQNRRKFRISMPNVTLNLSSILPICFCDEQNEQFISKCCEIIKLSDVSDIEKSLILDYILKVKALDYEITSIKLQDDLREKLLTLSIDDIEAELDMAIISNRKKGENINLTKENFVFKDRTYNKYCGFGGMFDESK